jgi:hypothetical protein
MACSNRRAPKPRRRAFATTETPNSALAHGDRGRVGAAVGEVRHRDQLEPRLKMPNTSSCSKSSVST